MDFGADNTGSVYLTGQTSSTDLPATTGAYDTTHNGSGDAYLAKLDSLLDNLTYLTYLGGSSLDTASALKVDEVTGEVYVAGRTSPRISPSPLAPSMRPLTAAPTTHSRPRSTPPALPSSIRLTWGGPATTAPTASPMSRTGRRSLPATRTPSDFPTTSDGTDRSYNSAGDVFVARLGRLGDRPCLFHFRRGTV